MPLHLAAKYGDKHFTFMIVMEADKMNIKDEIINMRDNMGLTPLYYLSEQGYRPTTDMGREKDDKAWEKMFAKMAHDF